MNLHEVLSGTADQIAWNYDMGCDHCGYRDGLEAYEAGAILGYGFECIDKMACIQREMDQRKDDPEWMADA